MLRPVPLRDEFPVLRRVAYLNAGTDGPVPRRAVAAARAELEREMADGRWKAHFQLRMELSSRQRSAYAGLLGVEPGDIALTTSTSEGLGRVLAGMDLGPGDEIVTSDEEHPGLIGPLLAARERRGVAIRPVPFAEVADAVGPATRLVACSHVSWATGRAAPAALAELDVPVLLDGAQSAGAIPVNVRTMGCAAYAGSGQKWLCGPDGTGMLYISPAFRDQVGMVDPGYLSFVDPARGFEAELHSDCRRYDAPSISAEATAFALASLDVLGSGGWEAVFRNGPALAARLTHSLSERGLEVMPRDETTLVSWRPPDDPERTRERLAGQGVVVRDLPGRGLLRASVGAWNDDEDLERLLAGL